MKSRAKTARKWILFWTLFIGIGALGGTAMMLFDPAGETTGMAGLIPFFQVLPLADRLFQNLIFSGIALLIVNGLTNLTAAALIFRKKRSGLFLGGLFGITLMLWIVIQFIIFPSNFMSTAYFFFGFFQAIAGFSAWIFDRQEAFSVSPSDYPNIGQDPQRLVVFFSRMGYSKKIALEEANRTGAAQYEIQTPEKTDGTLGFLWCGRFGMHRWAMPIEPLPENLSSYRHVTLCAPIWVFALCAPMRAFCRAARGQIREADLITLHHTRARYRNARREVEELLGLTLTGYRSLCCHCGKILSEQAEK